MVEKVLETHSHTILVGKRLMFSPYQAGQGVPMSPNKPLTG